MLECLREEPVQFTEKWLLTVAFIVWIRGNVIQVYWGDKTMVVGEFSETG
jgi:hypothetical protein